MNGSSADWSRWIALLVAGLVVLAALPGVAAAATRSGGTVVVEEGETVRDDLRAFGGTVIIRGTVQGDLEAFAGNVYIDGEVTGNVEASTGNLRISGEIGGNVQGSAGNVIVEEGALIGGDLEVAGGSVVVAGSIGGNARLAGGTVTLADSATIDGNVEYGVGDDGEFNDQGATVGGTITEKDSLSVGPFQPPRIPDWTFGVYGFLVNLALGAILLVTMPNVSRRITDRAVEEPLRTAGVGLLTLIGVPIVLVVVAITIIGIPIAILGAMLFALLIWVALVYGRFAIGVWLTSYVDESSKWVALLVGMVAIAIVNAIPVNWIGNLVEFGVLLVGLGAIAAVAYQSYRRRRGAGTEADASADAV